MTFLEAISSVVKSNRPDQFWFRPKGWEGDGLGYHVRDGRIYFMADLHVASFPSLEELQGEWQWVTIGDIRREQAKK